MASVLTRDLVLAVAEQFRLPLRSPHGPAHWMRVRTNGLLLAKETGANRAVVELFALFHDSRRASDSKDPNHGPRGAVLAEAFHRQGRFQCTDQELDTLMAACYGHTRGKTHPDITIATCWDADRLDLGRVGIIPAPHRLCTHAAAQDQVIDDALHRAARWAVKQG